KDFFKDASPMLLNDEDNDDADDNDDDDDDDEIGSER
ncbi:unnamed protein product, partial [Rotaria sp. Silwood1]